MAKKLYLTFLWHMHQPYYKDNLENKTLMPWVFLHAIKDYYDMPWLVSKFNIKVTFNLVPSLISGLESYAKNLDNDILLEVLKKDNIPEILDEKLLNRYLFLSNEKNMIKPLKRYHQLHQKFLLNNSIADWEFNEIIDSKVLFLLSWCGNYLRESSDIVKSLLNKEQYFTVMEKNLLIKELINFIPTILDFYKTLLANGQIALSTTPFYHPILPLLINFNSAIEAKNNVTLPNFILNQAPYSSLHTKFAIKYFQKIFGKKPKGFWPSEGGISQKTADLLCANGVQWCASDEDILFKTLNSKDRGALYKNYKLQTRYGLMDIRFRDRGLSDAIGFNYSNKKTEIAVDDFINRLKKIYTSNNFSPLVNIILDGENAWEFYPNNAKDFFIELYSQLEKLDFVQTITMDEVSEIQTMEHEYLPQIQAGSWINSNFDVWIGNKEKNKAWELISITLQSYLQNRAKFDKETTIKIQTEFMIAQSSDWFWWYGNDHYTILADDFDKLFRKHLINIFDLMKLEVPNEILKPIILNKKNNFHIEAMDYIKADLEKDEDYFEWLNCATVDLQKEFSVMDSKKMFISKFNYGYDKDNLYLKFQYDNLIGAKFIFKLDNIMLSTPIPTINSYLNHKEGFFKIFTGKNIRVKIPKALFKDKKRICFSFKLIKNSKIVQFFPIYGDFIIEFEKLKQKNWFI